MSNIHPTTELLERNSGQIKQPFLLVNPPELESLKAILKTLPKKSVIVLTNDWGIYNEANDLKVASEYNLDWSWQGNFIQALICLPKSDAEISLTLDFLSSIAKPNTEIGIVGQNNAGIKSAKKTLENIIGPVVFKDNARHSGLYFSTLLKTNKFFKLDNYWQSFKLQPDPKIEKLDIYSLPGTFSHGRLDEGTDLLLHSLLEHPLENFAKDGAAVLDWGCGSGSIGLFLAIKNSHSKIELVDTSSLAIKSAKRNIQENSLKNCKAYPSYLFSAIKDKYDFIVANPPFHKGRDTYYEDSENFCLKSSTLLKPHGKLRIVANKFLRYEQLLKEVFKKVSTVTEDNKYKILEASSPKT